VQATGIVGPSAAADGIESPLRLTRDRAQVVGDAHARFYEAVSRGNVYTLSLAATTSTIAAGNIVGAAAAASTQFALWNPQNSGKNLSLWRFAMSPISGTPTTGVIQHGLIITTAPTIATSGTIFNNLAGAASGVAKGVASAAGTALTGGSAPQSGMIADFGGFASAYASTTYIKTVEWLDGSIVLPPNTGWVPLHPGAGTTMLHGYSITWEEVTP
jgi:hypothetical protein